MKKPDHYSILGVPRNASLEEIRDAFFQAARHYHPDINISPGDTEYFLSATEAYEVLSNATKRSQYDAHLDPVKDEKNPWSYEIIFSRSHLVPIKEPQLIYAILKIKDSGRENETLPVNLCLIIDNSTSMAGTKLDHAKSSAINIFRRLRPQDSFSLVAFNDRAEILSGFGNLEDAPRIESRIHMIHPSGGTEIFKGLQAGFSEFRSGIKNNSLNHIILLTDGQTYGDDQKCMDLAGQAADQGIVISTIGIGSEWNDTLIDNLTSKTGGTSFHISNPNDIQSLLLEKIERIFQFGSKTISLEYDHQDHVNLNYALRLQPEPGLILVDNPILLGSPMGSTELSILLEIIVNIPEGSTEVELLKGNFIHQTAIQNPTSSSEEINLCLPVQSTDSRIRKPPREIVNAVSELTFFRMQEKARNEVDSGKIEDAIEHLQRLATHVLLKGKGNLYKLIQSEVDSLRSTHTFSAEGDKNIKYGTRSLLSTNQGDHSE